MNFYKTKKWIRKRGVILRRDNYECRECKRYGRVTQAILVHHINPLESHPQLALEGFNLLSLCNRCHEAMHIRKTHELTDKGKEWVERIKKLTPHLIVCDFETTKDRRGKPFPIERAVKNIFGGERHD